MTPDEKEALEAISAKLTGTTVQLPPEMPTSMTSPEVIQLHPDILTRDMGGQVRVEHLEASQAFEISKAPPKWTPSDPKPQVDPKPIIKPFRQ